MTTRLKFLLCLPMVFWAMAGRGAEVTVFAAASLTDSLRQIAQEYQERTHDKILFNFAGSSILARQIEEGAPADIFFSADENWMDELEQKGLILKATRKSRLSNSLVVIVEKDSPLSIASPRDLTRPGIGRIALADPQAVPAGVYARQFLQKENLWTAVGPKVVPVANVRAALAAVESGNVDAGIVYKTDARISRRVKTVFEVPQREGPKISYPMAVMKEAKAPEAARQFLQYLDSPPAARVFAQYGFIVQNGTP
jgi:molybdate transport system substrate-binding protein